MAFHDLELLAEGCAYRDCSHAGEQGCALAEAVSSGRLESGRLQSWLRLLCRMVTPEPEVAKCQVAGAVSGRRRPRSRLVEPPGRSPTEASPRCRPDGTGIVAAWPVNRMATWDRTSAEARARHGFTEMAAYATNAPIVVERAEGRETSSTSKAAAIWTPSPASGSPPWAIGSGLYVALREQLERVAHSTLLGHGNTAVVELAEALADVVPVDDARFLFVSDGAAAVEQALKIRLPVLVESGRHDENPLPGARRGLSRGHHRLALARAGGFGTDLFDPLRFPGVVRSPGYRDPGWLDAAPAALDEHAPELAAVVIEPLVQGAAGMYVASAADVGRLGAACQDAGVLLVCDEVATGFGRTGTLFASEQCGLQPDLLCLGKGLTGGYLPMSATAASGRVADAFRGEDLGPNTLYHGHSFSGNALAAAVALRHLGLLEEWHVLDNVAARAAQLEKRLAGLVAQRAVADVRTCGLMAGVGLDSPGTGSRWGRRVCAAGSRRGSCCAARRRGRAHADPDHDGVRDRSDRRGARGGDRQHLHVTWTERVAGEAAEIRRRPVAGVAGARRRGTGVHLGRRPPGRVFCLQRLPRALATSALVAAARAPWIAGEPGRARRG